jgi:Domain of Unknown Function (DUF1259)
VIRQFMKIIKTLSLLTLMSASLSTRAAIDTNRIEQLTRLKGAWNAAEEVFKVSAPRNDVPVSVDGWPMQPFRGLGSWAAFTAGSDGKIMVMGDLVLFQDEVNPVMSAALDSGLSVTALHNHFFFDEPRVYFMHIGGEGSLEQIATGVRRALDQVKEIRAAHSHPAPLFGGALPAQNAITAGPIEQTLGAKGESNNGMLKLNFARRTELMGTKVGGGMGVATWAAFGGTDDNAIVDGDFAVVEDELQPVLKTLRHAGINIVAIHNHMTHEEPRVLFLHYWGKGKAESLARGLKKALDMQKTAK